MARGSYNEDTVTASLRSLDFVSYIAQVGLTARRAESYYAASPDGVAALDLSKVQNTSGWDIVKSIVDDGKMLALARVEIKTRVSDSSLNEVAHRGGGRTYSGQWDSHCIREVVPINHLLPVMHQCALIGVNAALYAWAVETIFLYTSVIYDGGDHLLQIHRAESDAV